MRHIEFSVTKGDITNLPEHKTIIVNAANARLIPGGGVDGAINKAAGPQLAQAMAQVKANRHVTTSSAVTTLAYDLNADYVIHTIGPVYNEDKPEQSQNQLFQTYVTMFYEIDRIVNSRDDLSDVTIALPVISSGVYGYPFKPALEEALRGLKHTAKMYAGVLDEKNAEGEWNDPTYHFEFVIFDRNKQVEKDKLSIARELINKEQEKSQWD